MHAVASNVLKLTLCPQCHGVAGNIDWKGYAQDAILCRTRDDFYHVSINMHHFLILNLGMNEKSNLYHREQVHTIPSHVEQKRIFYVIRNKKHFFYLTKNKVTFFNLM